MIIQSRNLGLFGGKQNPLTFLDPDWRVVKALTDRIYFLTRAQNREIRYTYLYIHTVSMKETGRSPQAELFLQQHPVYEALDSVPDRLKWCRYRLNWTQKEVSEKLGVFSGEYEALERDSTRYTTWTFASAISQLYGRPAWDFYSAYSEFLDRGQARQIIACRTALGLSKNAFARHMGIPIKSLKDWETERVTVSYRSWEKFFRDSCK